MDESIVPMMRSTTKYKFSLVLPEQNRDSISNLPNSIEDFHSQNNLPSSRNGSSDRERDLLFHRSMEILLKPGELRNPKELRTLIKITEGFQYFQKLKEKQSNAILHSRFCRVMKLRVLRKGETLFYAGDAADRFYMILRGKVVILLPRTGVEIYEEKTKSPYDPEMTDRCLRILKSLERKTTRNSPKTAYFNPPRKSALFEFARKPVGERSSRESMKTHFSSSDRKRLSSPGLDQNLKAILKRPIIETVKMEDLDCPWKYFTEGAFHYTLGAVLKEGDYFGELGLLTKKPRKATVLCSEDCHLIYLEKEDYQNVLQSVDLDKMTRKIAFFEQHFLRGFTQDGVLKLSYFFIKKKYGLNQIIYEENEPIDGCYLIKKGEIALNKVLNRENTNRKENSLQKQELGNICTVGPGDFFGETEILLKNSGRITSAISRTTKLVVYFIEKELYLRTLGDKPGLYASFLEIAQIKKKWFSSQKKALFEQKIHQNKHKSRFNRQNTAEKEISYGASPTQSLPKEINVRTAVEDLKGEPRNKNPHRRESLSMAAEIRGKRTQGQISMDLTSPSQGDKIRRRITNNWTLEENIKKRSPILSVFNCFFSCGKERLKSRSFYQKVQKSIENANEASLMKTTERFFSKTFYLRNNETKEKFFNSPLKNSNAFESKETKPGLFKVFKLEGETLRTALSEIRPKKEKFQMEVRNFKPGEFFLRKTKHRQFFSMQRIRPRTMSAQI